MLKESQFVSIFCEIDDFFKELDKNMPNPQIYQRFVELMSRSIFPLTLFSHGLMNYLKKA
jgi:hypothetical protein